MADLARRQGVTTLIAAVAGILMAAGAAYLIIAIAFADEGNAAILFFALLAVLPFATLLRWPGGAEGAVFATLSIALLAAAALGMLSESIFISVAVLGVVLLGVFLLRSPIVACGALLAGAGLAAWAIWGQFAAGRLIEPRLAVGGAALMSLAVVFLLRWRQTHPGRQHAT